MSTPEGSEDVTTDRSAEKNYTGTYTYEEDGDTDKSSKPATVKPPEYDIEEAQNVVFRPNPYSTDTVLSFSEREVLYGGARGGGKSYATLADPYVT